MKALIYGMHVVISGVTTKTGVKDYLLIESKKWSDFSKWLIQNKTRKKKKENIAGVTNREPMVRWEDKPNSTGNYIKYE